MIDSLKDALNLQVLSIEKTLLCLNKVLDSNSQDEISSVTAALSRRVNEVVSKMIKKRRSAEDKQGVRRWNASTAVRATGAKPRKNMASRFSTNIDSTRKWSAHTERDPGFREYLQGPLGRMCAALAGHRSRCLRWAFHRLKGALSSSASIGTSTSPQEDSDDSFYSDNDNDNDHGNNNYGSSRWSTSEMDDQDRAQSYDYRDPFARADDLDDLLRDSRDLSFSDAPSQSEIESGSERSRSPELFYATNGEPIDVTEIGDFYRPQWNDFDKPPSAASTAATQSLSEEGSQRSQMSTSARSANMFAPPQPPYRSVDRSQRDADYQPLGIAMVADEQGSHHKLQKISMSPASLRLQRSSAEDPFLAQLEAEMQPIYEQSVRSSAVPTRAPPMATRTDRIAPRIPLSENARQILSSTLSLSSTQQFRSYLSPSKQSFRNNSTFDDLNGLSEGFELSP